MPNGNLPAIAPILIRIIIIVALLAKMLTQ